MSGDISTHLRTLFEKNGHLTAEIVLDAAKPKRSPLHAHFEWDDSTAANEYRLDQARALIRSVRVERENGYPIRAYVHIDRAASTEHDESLEDGAYFAEDVIGSSPLLRQAALAQMQRDLEALDRKWSAYREWWALRSAPVEHDAVA